MTAGFPLQWPPGWPRTRPQDRAWSLPGGRAANWNQVVKRLRQELERLGVSHVVLSTDQPIRQDGHPYQAPRRIDDPGAAVYFTRNGKPLVIAQDRYELLVDNIRSIAIAIEHMRGLERHGGGHMMDRAFAGFEALPAPGEHAKRSWRQVLGIDPTGRGSIEAAEAQYRALARQHHPDAGGTQGAMAELNAAIDEARKELAP